MPNMSTPGHANECQKHTPGRRWSSIRVPEDEPVRLVDLERERGRSASRPPNGIGPVTSVKNASPTPGTSSPSFSPGSRAVQSL